MAAGTENKEYLNSILYPHLDDTIGLTVIIVTIVFFFIVNDVIRRLSRRVVALKKTSEWRWRNLAVSWVHAVFCSSGIFYCYASYRQHIQTLGDMIDFRPYAAYMLTAFSAGYFLYDFLDHILERQLIKQWEVILHHIAVLYIFGYNLVFHTALAFSVLALIVEINSVFLHGRKLLQMVELPYSHWFYRTTVALNFASFIFFRGAAMVLIWAGIIYNADRVSTAYYYALSLVMVFMVVLNPMLFWRLLKSDCLRGRRKKKAAVTQKDDGGHVTEKNSHVTQNGSPCSAAPLLRNESQKKDFRAYGNGACKSKSS